MTFNAGILIIGSLYWDDSSHRAKWREDRLAMSSAFVVTAPIRYGRWSINRKSYSMVFSQLCRSQNSLGTARVVPCRNRVLSADDLVKEAKELWRAEESGLTDPRTDIGFSAKWGCVAILPNPRTVALANLLADWRAKVKGKGPYGALNYTQSEASIVDGAGVLQINWPEPMPPSGKLDSLDLLLATANDPTIKGAKYPTPKAVAEAWLKEPKERHYFDNNQFYKITTFEDKVILQHLPAGKRRSSTP